MKKKREQTERGGGVLSREAANPNEIISEVPLKRAVPIARNLHSGH